MQASVAVFGTFDTKGREFELLKTVLEYNGVQTVMIDTGLTKSTYLNGDIIVREHISADELGDVTDSRQRAHSLELISQRAAKLVSDMQCSGKISGVISMGGGQGTYIAGKVMRMLPVGFPKVLLSTLALVQGSAAQFSHLNDTVVINSLVDISGINGLLKNTINEAAGALCGMINALGKCSREERKSAAISAWGVTTPCVNYIRGYLDSVNVDPLVFHSNGEGGAILESLCRQKAVCAVVDITWSEESIPLAGGALPFVPGRFEGAIESRIPRVMAPGGTDMILARAADIAEGGRFYGRKVYQHNPEVLFVRSTAEDNLRFARSMAQKLNRSSAVVKLLLPLGGLSSVDMQGQLFWDQDCDYVLFETLKKEIHNPLVEIRELDCHINSGEFAKTVISELSQII